MEKRIKENLGEKMNKTHQILSLTKMKKKKKTKKTKRNVNRTISQEIYKNIYLYRDRETNSSTFYFSLHF